MKSLLSRNTVSDQFEGRTLDEAVRHARRELGDDAMIRCWKVRRGGVLGFFTHEYYVAGLTPPPSVVRDAPAELSLQPTIDDVESYELSRYPIDREWRESSSISDDLTPMALEDLVAATDDEVTLRADDVTRRAFGEVLAQAEALLMSPSPDVSPLTYGRPDQRGDLGLVSPSLRTRLANLGVPEEYLPDEDEGFDALWSRLASLPSAPSPCASAGLVVAVAGSRRDALATAKALVDELGLEARDVIDDGRSSDVRRRVQRRRRTTRTSVVVVEAPVGAAAVTDVGEWLGHLGATYVIGALGANAKRADVRRWLDQLRIVDTLACWRLGDAASVADLMGLAPIYLLDGSPASPMRWLSELIGALGRLEH